MQVRGRCRGYKCSCAGFVAYEAPGRLRTAPELCARCPHVASTHEPPSVPPVAPPTIK